MREHGTHYEVVFGLVSEDLRREDALCSHVSL